MFLSIICLFSASSLSAQGFNFSKILNKKKDTIRVLNSSQQDSMYLQHPFRDKLNKFKQDFKKKWDKSFIDFTDNQINLLAGLNFSKQNILLIILKLLLVNKKLLSLQEDILQMN